MEVDPVFRTLLAYTYRHFSFTDSIVHGLPHWQNVWHNALYLSEKEGVDSLVPQLFAISHDFQRRNDAIDPQHGLRAAEKLQGNPILEDALTTEQFWNLRYACQTHTGGKKHRMRLSEFVGMPFDLISLE